MRRLAALLMALALAVRLAVPVGYMPATGGALAICGGQLAAPMSAEAMRHMAMAMPHHGGGQHHDGHDQTAEQGNCAFAALGGALDLGGAPAPLAAASFVAVALTRLFPVLSARPGLAAPPPPKTGPPILR